MGYWLSSSHIHVDVESLMASHGIRSFLLIFLSVGMKNSMLNPTYMLLIFAIPRKDNAETWFL